MDGNIRDDEHLSPEIHPLQTFFLKLHYLSLTHFSRRAFHIETSYLVSNAKQIYNP